MASQPLSVAEAGPTFAGFGSAFTPGAFGAGGGATTTIADNVGYIDSAIIRSRVRVRFDANYDDTSPDKAEFFYPKCGCFANPMTALNPMTRSLYDPHARGPQHAVGRSGVSQFSGEPRINYQEVTTYLEYAPVRNFSAFIEVPARFIQPTLVRNAAGFSDLNLGSKFAFIANPNQYYTFQFRAYAPTGNSYQGLGTGHVSLEPRSARLPASLGPALLQRRVPRLDPRRRIEFRRERAPLWCRPDLQHRPDGPSPDRPGQRGRGLDDAERQGIRDDVAAAAGGGRVRRGANDRE